MTNNLHAQAAGADTPTSDEAPTAGTDRGPEDQEKVVNRDCAAHAVVAEADKAFPTLRATLAVNGAPGFGLQYGRRAYVNVDKARTHEQLIGVTGHESLHWLESNDSAAATAFYDGMADLLRPDAIGAQLAFENANLTPGEKPMSEAGARSEVMANINGAMWLDPGFWSRLYDLDGGSTFKKVLYAFMKTATKFVRVTQGGAYDAKRYVTDVKAAREVAARVWADRSQSRDGTPTGDNVVQARRGASPLDQDLFAEPQTADAPQREPDAPSPASGFNLVAPTKADVLAQQQARIDEAKSEAAGKRAQDDAARKDREQRDIADRSRQDASADNFQLGQRADDALSGQGGLFQSRATAIPQTQTAEFKRWFGDWQAATRARRLRAMPTTRLPQFDSIESADAAYAKSQGQSVATADGATVTLTGKARREMRSHAAAATTRQVLGNARGLLGASIRLWSEPVTSADPGNAIRAYHYYGTRAELVGSPAWVRFVVRETVNGEMLYDGDASVEQPTKEPGALRVPNAPLPSPGRATDRSIASWLQSVDRQPSSKVVDADGKPLVVYHGTKKPFTRVDMKKGAQGVFWVTSDKGSIERGESGAQSASAVMELYATIKNPAGWKEYDQLSLDEIEGRGFDGVMLPNKDGTFDAIVFDPKQVKSATGNRGTFDPATPDIRYSRRAPAGIASVNQPAVRDTLSYLLDSRRRHKVPSLHAPPRITLLCDTHGLRHSSPSNQPCTPQPFAPSAARFPSRCRARCCARWALRRVRRCR